MRCRSFAATGLSLFAILASSINPSPVKAQAAGPVAAYAFSEASGATTADASGNNNTGTLNGATHTTAGQFGNALVFNGPGAFVDLGNPATLQLTGSMTISAWINAAAFPVDDAAVVSRRTGGTPQGYQLDITADTGPRTIGFKLTSAAGGNMFRYGATALQLNQWYFVTGVYDAAAQTLDVYLNGILDNGTLLGPVSATQQNSPLNVNIGRRSGLSGYAFNGTIDEVRLYSRALTQAEIQSDMAAPVDATPPPSDTTPPTAPTVLSASVGSASQIDLSWTASTDNVGVTGYQIDRCQGTGCTTFAQIGVSTATGFSDTGLAAATTYRYRVRATDAAGNVSANSSVVAATTQAVPDTTPPTAPSGLSATAASSAQINLVWTASTDNVAVTGYLVERCEGAGCTTFVQIATPNATSFNDTGLTASTSYSYRVRATDAAGNLSAYSGVVASATSSAPAGSVAAYAFSEASGATTADASGNNTTGTLNGATHTTAGQFGNALVFDGTGAFVDLGNPATLQLTGSMTISAWVKATAFPVDDAAIVSKRNAASLGYQLDATKDTGPRTIGFKLTSAAGGNMFRYGATALQLNQWYFVTGVYDAAAQTLDVYLNGILDNGTLLGPVSATQQNSPLNVNIGRRSGLSGYAFNGTIDEVRLYSRALTQAEIQSDMAAPVDATPPPSDTTPPTAPAGLSAAATSTVQTSLAWAAATDNVEVAGYRVERCQGAGCSSFAQIAAPTGTSLNDSGLSASTSYSYQVRAADAAGNLGAYSNIASATTPAPDTSAPTAPTGLTATAASSTQINLTWTASTDNVGVTGYRVERCQGAGCSSFAQIAAPTGTSLNDSGLSASTSYSYQVRAVDAAGNLSAYSGVVGATTNASGTALPLVVSVGARYLQDQNGVPFPILGRTAWFITSLPEADYKAFIDDTVAKGYNAIEFHVINHDPRGNNPPFGGNGALPFTKRLDGNPWDGSLTYTGVCGGDPTLPFCEAPDFSTPNEAYWTHVDALLAYAESKGVLCFMFPAYVGFRGGEQGWMHEMVVNKRAKMTTYGAFIADRYKARGNIVWMLGGDYSLVFDNNELPVEQGLLAGMQSVPGQASVNFSAEWNSNSIYTDQTDPTLRAAGTLQGAYSFSGDVNTYARKGYAHSPAMPSFLLEEPYDEEGPDGTNFNGSATQPVRRYQWWGWLSGIGGYISGNGYVWPFNVGVWTNHLNTQGAQDMAQLNAFVRSIAWYNLVPSDLAGMKTLVTAGGSSPASSDYVAAAATPDGTLLVAYVPPDHTGPITLDMTAMSGPVQARWFNPASAAYTVIGTFDNTGPVSFTPPGNNGSGFRDWVLLLERQ